MSPWKSSEMQAHPALEHPCELLLGRIFLKLGITPGALLHGTALLGMLDKQINQPQSSPEEGINVPCLYRGDWETEAQRDLRGFKGKKGEIKEIIPEQGWHREREGMQSSRL